jgi:uncharacterized membrane protein (Fun14 family)
MNGVTWMNSETSLLLAQVATEATAGGVTGFLIGYGVRQVAAIALKIVAVGTALLLIPIAWLSSMGVVKVDFEALMNLVGKALSSVANTLASTIPILSQMAPATAGFGLGFFAGVMKK